MPEKVSCVSIAKNEQNTISRCLDSVGWMDEIIVVDTGSTDHTVEICHQYGVKVFEIKWTGFGNAKRFAVEQASYDWIFSIDCDEVMTSDLQKKIRRILEQPELFEGYCIKRCTYYLGKQINWCGWNHDYPLRLFNRKYGTFNNAIVHESVCLCGRKGRIEEHLLHYSYPDIKTHISKINHYTELGAKRLLEKGKKSSPVAAYEHGLVKFIKMYFIQQGFLDGIEGLILAIVSAFGVHLKYLKLWQKKRETTLHQQ